jgi:hypothetical protein
MSDYRHHVAVRTEYVFVPIEIGSPKEASRGRPPAYPHQRREAWRPAQHPPRLSKAQRTAKFLDAMWRREAEARSFMDEARRASLLRGERHAQ